LLTFILLSKFHFLQCFDVWLPLFRAGARPVRHYYIYIYVEAKRPPYWGETARQLQSVVFMRRFCGLKYIYELMDDSGDGMRKQKRCTRNCVAYGGNNVASAAAKQAVGCEL